MATSATRSNPFGKSYLTGSKAGGVLRTLMPHEQMIRQVQESSDQSYRLESIVTRYKEITHTFFSDLLV